MAQVKQEKAYIETVFGRNDKVAEKQEWSGDIRNIDCYECVSKGDSFIIPEKHVIREIETHQGILQYCIVELTKANGERVPMQFFPNMLAKVAMARDAEGNALGRVKTSGTAADAIQQFLYRKDSMRKAMNFLAGRTIKVVDAQEVTVMPYGKSTYDLKKDYCVLEKTRIFVYNLEYSCHKEQLQSDDEWVDLRLPSGKLWATCNIGASRPEESGDYFAWGEIKPKAVYDWTTYLYCDGNPHSLTKYGPIFGFLDYSGATLNDVDDVSDQFSRGYAHIPSVVDWQELIRYTYSEGVTINGIKGVRFTSSNGNSIFLPKAGFVDSDNVKEVGLDGKYWCAEVLRSRPEYAYYRSLLEYDDCNFVRCIGLSVRAVSRGFIKQISFSQYNQIFLKTREKSVASHK